jgi:microcystin-dependent protein
MSDRYLGEIRLFPYTFPRRYRSPLRADRATAPDPVKATDAVPPPKPYLTLNYCIAVEGVYPSHR